MANATNPQSKIEAILNSDWTVSQDEDDAISFYAVANASKNIKLDDLKKLESAGFTNIGVSTDYEEDTQVVVITMWAGVHMQRQMLVS